MICSSWLFCEDVDDVMGCVRWYS